MGILPVQQPRAKHCLEGRATMRLYEAAPMCSRGATLVLSVSA